MKCPGHFRAFTLVEVLVALAVLSLALMAALRASSVGVSTSNEIRDRLLAGWVAQNRLAEHRARRDWLPVGVFNGECASRSACGRSTCPTQRFSP
jgi:general secretion pathway protein I